MIVCVCVVCIGIVLIDVGIGEGRCVWPVKSTEISITDAETRLIIIVRLIVVHKFIVSNSKLSLSWFVRIYIETCIYIII